MSGATNGAGAGGNGAGAGGNDAGAGGDASAGASGSDSAGAGGVRQEPELYWKFDETSGTTVVDFSGNGLDGSYGANTTTFPTPAAGDVPPALSSWDSASLRLVGSHRQYVRLESSNPQFHRVRSANDFSISIWFKVLGNEVDASGNELVTLGDHYVIRLGAVDGRSRIEWNKRFINGPEWVNCYFEIYEGSGPAFLDGKWHHLVAIQSSTTGMALYLDGAVLATFFLANGSHSTDDVIYAKDYGGRDFHVGRHGESSPTFDFQGNVDELRIYRRVLPLAEIQRLAAGLQ